MIIQNVIQAVQDRIPHQALATRVGVDINRVANLTGFRVDVVYAGINLVAFSLGIIMETQHLLLRLSVRSGINILQQSIVCRQEEAIT